MNSHYPQQTRAIDGSKWSWSRAPTEEFSCCSSNVCRPVWQCYCDLSLLPFASQKISIPEREPTEKREKKNETGADIWTTECLRYVYFLHKSYLMRFPRDERVQCFVPPVFFFSSLLFDFLKQHDVDNNNFGKLK